MAKKKDSYRCSECGNIEFKWLGRCPQCNSWNSFELQAESISTSKLSLVEQELSAQKLTDLELGEDIRLSARFKEIDRILGGGFVVGTSTLLGGAPGIGKSTILLQVAGRMASPSHSCLYISGEESAKQIKLRTERLQINNENINLLCTNNLDIIQNNLQNLKPKIVIIDSIQTLLSIEIGQVPGTGNQLRHNCYILIQWAKENNACLVLVAHITKDGYIAGPKLIEHMVDLVLYFELSEDIIRILRASKNRFGTTDEIGLFSMQHDGLIELADPHSIFLVDRGKNVPAGITVVPVYEGSRILMVEIQCLSVQAKGSVSRVFADKIDPRRISRLAAVLEKQLGLSFSDQDIYINVAGGLKIQEVGIELPLALVLFSAKTGRPIPANLISMGEITLAGELRNIRYLDQRIKAARDLGFNKFITPHSSSSFSDTQQVARIQDAIKEVFSE